MSLKIYLFNFFWTGCRSETIGNDEDRTATRKKLRIKSFIIFSWNAINSINYYAKRRGITQLAPVNASYLDDFKRNW